MNQDPSRPDDTQPQWEPAPQDMPQFAAGPPARKRRGRVVAGVAVALVAMAGLAFAGVRLFGALTGTQDVLAEKVPAQSLVYVTAVVENQESGNRVADATATIMETKTVVDPISR